MGILIQETLDLRFITDDEFIVQGGGGGGYPPPDIKSDVGKYYHQNGLILC
jgi:hypothetical protein